MSSKYTDTTAILQVIGCIFNNPELLGQTDKYNINDEDFSEPFHRIMFGALYKLYELGAKEFTLKNIADFFSVRPKYEAIYKTNNGEEWISKISQNANLNTFDYYYNRLKKFSLLRAYDNIGVSVIDIYDIDNIMDTKKKQLQEERLDNSSLEEIADKIDNKINGIRLQYVEDEFGEASQAGDGLEDLINKFKEAPEVGVPLYGPLINTVTRGARLKKFYLRSAPTGCGKAIPNYTLIPTPIGWRKVGDIRPGDYLFGQDGKPTKVLNIFPQETKKEIWEVEFSDGRVAECCEDHLWEYSYEGGWRVESLKEIVQRVSNLKNGLKNDDGVYRFYIKLNEAVERNEKKYSVEPHAMGLILSDGSFSSKDKFIPKDYLDGSIEQRMNLLSGLLDGNGSIDSNGRIEFTTISKNLRDNVIELCRSLGFIASVSIDSQNDKYTTGECYSALIQTKEEIKPKLFRLNRNAEIAIACINSNKRSEYKNGIAIVDIRPTGRKTAMTCFTVDNDSHLFLMNDYIVTHNTRSMIADACYISCEKIYDENFGWIKCGVMEPTLYITTEQELEEVQTMMLAFIANVNEEHILNGEYESGEEERVFEAAKIIKKAPLYVEELPDFSLRDIENKIKKNIRDHGVKYVAHDYVHTSLKILEEITRRSGGIKLREDNVLFMISTRLKDLCNQYGIFILSATQLSAGWKEEKIPDQNLLRGAKSIADVASPAGEANVVLNRNIK